MIFNFVFNVLLKNSQQSQGNLREFKQNRIKHQLFLAAFIFQKNYPLLILLSRIIQIK